MKYSIITFGCRVNHADSLAAEESLCQAGARRARSPGHADLVIVNTCSVTMPAEQDARQAIRRVARENPAARIVVTGCYATRRPDDVSGLPHVSSVVPNADKPRLCAFLAAELGSSGGGSSDDCAGAGAAAPGLAGRTSFTLRVQTGCDERCAYCVVPSTRGRPISAPPAEVLGHIARLVAAGYKEIVLAGVHLGAYGRDLAPRSSLAELLHAIAERPWLECGWGPPVFIRGRESTLEAEGQRSRGGERGWGPASSEDDVLFRLSSLEPMDCTPDIVDLVAGSDLFAPHLHLPLQHASDRILRAMRRPYTIGQYSAVVDAVRARIPHAAIGTDVIAGFPGETDDDFERLASYLERSPLTQVHVFPYSARPGTAASTLRERVPGVVVRERARRLRAVGRAVAARFRQSQMGAIHRGLTIEDGTIVVTGNHLKVRIPPGRRRNEWVMVRVGRHASDDGIRDGGLGIRAEVLLPPNPESQTPNPGSTRGSPPAAVPASDADLQRSVVRRRP